ncbi:hypothetical protein [Gelatiniphilus marinus]|uniref:Adenylate kinase n=1 Tax=Gelatiniphilus marinus TaxID=1759464 RepID=A0ABW5JP66_9FLAO
MLYIISGVSRAGKTIVAKKLASQKGISYLSLDWLVMGFTNGIPEYGLHHMLLPDEIAKKIWGFFKAIVESMLWNDVDYIIEGEAILPELIIELFNKHPNKLKICFLGFADISVDKKVEEIKEFSCGKKDWLIDKSDKYMRNHVKNMMAHSKTIKASCNKHNLRYFDVSKNFVTAINNAMCYLKT